MKKKILAILMSAIVLGSGIQTNYIVANAKSSGLTVKSSDDTKQDKTDKKSDDLTVNTENDNDTPSVSINIENDANQNDSNTSESDYIELAGDGETPIFSSDYLSEYLEKNGINLPKQKKKSMMKSIMKKNSNPVYLTEKSSGQYLVTNETSDLIYYGDTKDNKPNGKGKILKIMSATQYEYAGHTMLDFSECDYATDEDDMYAVNVYMGEFKNGYYQGYGWKFAIPLGRDYQNSGRYRDLGANYVAVTDDMQENIFETCNPISYMGEFKKGKYSGTGIEILYPILELSNGMTKEELKKLEDDGADKAEGGDREIILQSGTYSKDKENGKMKIYRWGKLFYDGNMKKGKYDGKGILYFLDSDQIKYKGQWKSGEYNGKGTLYNEDGSVKYKGKWDFGDYAH